ncbi:hypothetical protein BACUNI_02187 [Bacteroides uniformis ATCC 8492]|uniref:Uncharacterized protein n=1 Tax=Bacteroides uniformis (strain ATCC 8492 / DSM 6597 / CCUG 4942 / CIP 103695 / JCM 5828 / KCTC 5204 / NCTC 13054 / VPI 0061) TaxID=411479 RepID=A0ABC9NBK3_BACUC|nr:hypothetical protein BACUNI_02187 [Bacteroides uniformis ATCC 8492]
MLLSGCKDRYFFEICKIISSFFLSLSPSILDINHYH